MPCAFDSLFFPPAVCASCKQLLWEPMFSTLCSPDLAVLGFFKVEENIETPRHRWHICADSCNPCGLQSRFCNHSKRRKRKEMQKKRRRKVVWIPPPSILHPHPLIFHPICRKSWSEPLNQIFVFSAPLSAPEEQSCQRQTERWGENEREEEGARYTWRDNV